MTGKPFAPPEGHIMPRELLARMRAIAAANAPGSAAARNKVLAALIDCLRSIGYGEALKEAEKLLAPDTRSCVAWDAHDTKPAIAHGAAAAAIAVENAIAEPTEK